MRLILRTVFTTGTAATFSLSALTRWISAKVLAGGGGGGGTSQITRGCGGGAAGGFAEYDAAVQGGETVTYTVGAGGAGGVTGTGTAGGNSTFALNGTTVTATGGPGGLETGAEGFSRGGASPAISTNGNLNQGGQPGEWGRSSATAAILIAGKGGAARDGQGNALGAGGNAKNTSGAGNNAIGYGSGGGGGAFNASGTGGNGTAGLIVLDEWGD